MVLAYQDNVQGHLRHIKAVGVESGLPPIADLLLRRGER